MWQEWIRLQVQQPTLQCNENSVGNPVCQNDNKYMTVGNFTKGLLNVKFHNETDHVLYHASKTTEVVQGMQHFVSVRSPVPGQSRPQVR